MAPAAVMWPFTAATVGIPNSMMRRMSRSASVWMAVDCATFAEMYLLDKISQVHFKSYPMRTPNMRLLLEALEVHAVAEELAVASETRIAASHWGMRTRN